MSKPFKIGPRTNILAVSPAGERDGYVSWDRKIGANKYHFSVRWAADDRYPAAPNQIYDWHVTVIKDGDRSYRDYGMNWEGMPHGNVYGAEPDVRDLPACVHKLFAEEELKDAIKAEKYAVTALAKARARVESLKESQ